MNDLISRKALLAEYDRVHIGEPGKARKLIEDAPRVDAVDLPHWATERAYKNGYEQGKKDATDNNVAYKMKATADNLSAMWIPVTERFPPNFVSVLGYMTDAGDFPPVRECYTVGNAFYFPALGDVHPVSKWCEMPTPSKGE